MQSTRYSCQILTKLEFSLQIFEKYINIKLLEDLSTGSLVIPRDGQRDGRTDRQNDKRDKPNSRFSQFCEHT
jgi:hypothetical protein